MTCAGNKPLRVSLRTDRDDRTSMATNRYQAPQLQVSQAVCDGVPCTCEELFDDATPGGLRFKSWW